MNKAKAIKTKTNNKFFLIIGLVIGIVLITGTIVVLSNTNNYAGTYNLDNRYSIVLKQDRTCDFTELGESGYSNNKQITGLNGEKALALKTPVNNLGIKACLIIVKKKSLVFKRLPQLVKLV
ncbi:hypothetical protein J6V85_02195 [Candidatus Saccharibacteria bacterium]|nr:hypothetical protein [Candidatus Saccharibacteria bacterium]